MKNEKWLKLVGIPRGDNIVLFVLAFLKLVVHLTTNLSGGYGIFRDEFYYIACSRHMAWGYVDQPPFSIAALWLNRHFFGGSLFALRLLPALAGAATVFLAGMLARKLGGGKFAQALAAASALCAPLLLGMNGYFSMNAFDILFWTISFHLIALIAEKDDRRHWLLLGVTLGLGLLNKISVLWLGAGILVGLLLTGHRRLLLKRNAWIAVGLAFLIFLPHIVWQIANHFPTLEFIRNASGGKYVATSPIKLFSEQILNMNPATLLFWLPGLVYFLAAGAVRKFHILPIIYLTVFAVLAVNGSSKSEYLGPMFPMLFALGAVALDKFIARFRWGWLKPFTLALLLFGGIAIAPLAIPILPVDGYIAYARALGLAPSTPEKKELGSLPQHYADCFGWEKLVRVVAAAYNMLTAEEKALCTIMANNYGEAGAIDFYGQLHGLPEAISGHNNYWLWGPRGSTGEVVIRLGGSPEAMRESYGEVIHAGIFHDEYCMPYENNQTVWICKRRQTPLAAEWADFKHYD